MKPSQLSIFYEYSAKKIMVYFQKITFWKIKCNNSCLEIVRFQLTGSEILISLAS